MNPYSSFMSAHKMLNSNSTYYFRKYTITLVFLHVSLFEKLFYYFEQKICSVRKRKSNRGKKRKCTPMIIQSCKEVCLISFKVKRLEVSDYYYVL